MSEHYSAVVMAGGRHERFGEANPLREKLGGLSLLSHSLDVFDNDENCSEILISASRDIRGWVEGDLLTFSSGKLKLVDALAERALSVQAAAEKASQPVLLVHDANRPNISQDTIFSLLDALRPGYCVAPALYASGPAAYITSIGDAELPGGGNGGDPRAGFFGEVKRRRPDRRIGHLMEHIDRDGLVLLQSPQACYRDELLAAYSRLGDELARYDDESALLLAAGHEVVIVEGRMGNFPVVTQAELKLLIKLMGLPSSKPKKDKYGGLGW